MRLALDDGFWCGMTLYPTTNARRHGPCDIIEMVGTDRIMVELGRRLGQVRPAGGAGVDPGDAAPRPRRERRSAKWSTITR